MRIRHSSKCEKSIAEGGAETKQSSYVVCMRGLVFLPTYSKEYSSR
jgi:hypothetical protein